MGDNAEALRLKLFDYHAKAGKLPPKSLLCHELGLTLDEVNAGLRALVAAGWLREFAGKLRLGRGQPVARPGEVAARALGLAARAWRRLRAVKVDAEALVKAAMLAISLVAMYVSITFSYVWVSQLLEPAKAFLLSGAIVVYLSLAPEGALVLFRARRGFASVVAVLLVATGLMALVFSMAMTTIGQYNLRGERLAAAQAQAAPAAQAQAALDLARAREKTAAESLAATRAQVTLQQAVLAKEKPEAWTYQQAVWQLADLQGRVAGYERELAAARADQLALVKDEAVVTAPPRADFYAWLAGVTGAAPAQLEFALYLAPALFCDVIAPLGLFVALGLYRRKEEKR